MMTAAGDQRFLTVLLGQEQPEPYILKLYTKLRNNRPVEVKTGGYQAYPVDPFAWTIAVTPRGAPVAAVSHTWVGLQPCSLGGWYVIGARSRVIYQIEAFENGPWVVKSPKDEVVVTLRFSR